MLTNTHRRWFVHLAGTYQKNENFHIQMFTFYSSSIIVVTENISMCTVHWLYTAVHTEIFLVTIEEQEEEKGEDEKNIRTSGLLSIVCIQYDYIPNEIFNWFEIYLYLCKIFRKKVHLSLEFYSSQKRSIRLIGMWFYFKNLTPFRFHQ